MISRLRACILNVRALSRVAVRGDVTGLVRHLEPYASVALAVKMRAPLHAPGRQRRRKQVARVCDL